MITPFTVIDLLRRIHGDQSMALSSEMRKQLESDIAALEHAHFSPTSAANADANAGDNAARSSSIEHASVAQRWLASL